MFQFLSFYQREMALFTAHNLDRKAADFCLDSELTPHFKVNVVSLIGGVLLVACYMYI
jgi:hypothetical protein